nr:reverse transcriptase domain-containing protein [Tanacetum cinerariifolium]
MASEPVIAPVSATLPNEKLSIPYPSRRDNEKRRDQANEQIKKFYEIFKEMSFEISFTDALILMPKFASTLKDLIGNKEKLSEMARTTMNEHCSADSLNFAAGGNFLDKIPSDCLKINESKSKLRQSRAKAVVAKVNSSSSTLAISSDVAELKDMVRELLLDKKNQSSALAPSPTPALVKAVEPNCVTCGGPIIPTPSKVVKQGTEVTKDQVQTPSSQCIAPVQPSVALSETLVFEPVVAPVSAPMPNLKPSIPYPLRRDNERRCDQDNEQIKKFFEIFKDMSFEISFTDALILMPKFASTLKALIRNKEKLSEMVRTPMNEHCSAVILNNFPKKLGDPGKFLILCEFPGMDECLALTDLGASINLMPLSMWEELSLPELTPTCMTLELADRSVSKPIGIAKDVKVKVGMFHFPANFVVVDFEPDPLKTCQALIDVHKGELTLRIRNEAIIYNLDQTSRYPANYDQMMANKIDVTEEACEEYSQEVLSFSNVTVNGNPTPSDDPIISTTSPTLTPFGDSDFLIFEEADAFLDHEQSMPSFKNELKACEAKTIKSSVDEPHEVELKDLPPHLEYAFLEGDNKLPLIIAKELGDEEKSALIKDSRVELVCRKHEAKHLETRYGDNDFEACYSNKNRRIDTPNKEGWDPLIKPTNYTDIMSVWKDLLQGNKIDSPYAQLFIEVMLSLQRILGQIVMPKLLAAVNSWDPHTDSIPIHNWEQIMVRCISPKLLAVMHEFQVNPVDQKLDQYNWRIDGKNEDKMLDEMLKWKSTLLVEEAKRLHGDNLNLYEYNCHPMLEWGNKKTINARGSQNSERMVDPGYEKLKQTPAENKMSIPLAMLARSQTLVFQRKVVFCFLDAKEIGKITYNEHELHEFYVQRTSAYISQTENNIVKLTVQKTLDFGARCEGEWFAGNLAGLTRLENKNKIRPSPEIDASMKASYVVH